MAYALGLDTSFCTVGDSIVFLDAARDRYYCLPAGARTAFDRLVDSLPLLAGDTEALAPLVRQGLVTVDDGGTTSITPCHLPDLPETHLCAAPGAAVAHLGGRGLVSRPRSYMAEASHVRHEPGRIADAQGGPCWPAKPTIGGFGCCRDRVPANQSLDDLA